MFNNKIIFITWWTWTWWQAIIKNLLEWWNVKKIIIFSRWEDKQVSMEREFDNKKLQFVLWDIRNKDLLRKITQWVDYIIHLAALKHVSKCEENNSEAIWININWTQNIIDISIENKIDKVLYISTDKAVDPYNLYWDTKAISEKLITNANKYLNNEKTIFYTIRAWNILWSNWSVIKVFFNQIRNKKTLMVTNLNMKRFYVTIEEIISLITYSFSKSKGWEIYILKWDIFSLKNILDLMIDIYWDWKEKISELWMKKWEKIDEILISNNEINNTYEIEKKYFVIDSLWRNNYKNYNVSFKNYSTTIQKKNDFKKLRKNIINLLWK